VKGASEGEGLGNQFLANIREVDAIVHVIRCFEDPDVQHVMGEVDPVRDREVINIELGLADLASVEKRLDKTGRAAKSGDAQSKVELRLLQSVQVALAAGRPARSVVPTEEESTTYRSFNLLTAKPVLYAANVAEHEISSGNRFVDALTQALQRDGETAEVVTFSAKVEAELAELDPEERVEFLESLGLHESGLDRLAHAAYHLLGLQSYFTAGEKEVRAWTVHRGDKAPAAAGVIHSDFEKGFIRAETVAYGDFVRLGGWKPAREQGLARAEGKEYVVQDGDVMLFRFNP
jgi:GTP-binding protein YchF